MSRSEIKHYKKVIVFLLITALALPLGIISFGRSMGQVEAEGTATRYFYTQLTDKEKPFYNALEEMYTSGMLMTGKENLELTKDGNTTYVTQEDLASYASGYPDLLSWMGAARDAFYFDHPDIFYVDFSAISLRVTMDNSGIYHAYLGTGRRDNYYNEAFTNEKQVKEAISKYNDKMDEILKDIENRRLDETIDRTRQQIVWVHNYVTTHTKYQLESDYESRPSDSGQYLIRTAYGSLVNGESACEGYSRAMKAILDRLDIPCVLVQGVYLHTADQPEPHMWNYVQLNGKWYGLDATMDDPIKGVETNEYLLVGGDIMGARHVPDGILSSANKEFRYPTLIAAGEQYEVLQNVDDLVVEYKTDIFEGLEAGYFRVSYQGMGYAEAAKKGKYILARLSQHHLGDDLNDLETYSSKEWYYADPSIYEINKLQEPGALILPLPHCIYAEFAVTDIAPNLPEDITQFDPQKHSYFYEGDPFLFLAQSKRIYNPSGTYIAPPYPVSMTPSLTSRMVMEQSYDVSITYNDKLVQVDGEKPWYSLTATGPTAVKYSKIENFKWDGDRTISFRFTPSKMFADESIYYYFNLTGLVGEKSGKPPIEMIYAVSSGISPYRCPLCGDDYDWKLFAKPSLLENGDLSMSGWETSDGSKVSDLLKDRIALVVTNPTSAQDAAMNEMLTEENEGHKVLSSSTYNITLTVCNMMVVKTGQKVKISVGFPEGYGPEDEGVTFKAYHFTRDAAGNVTGVEEIPCVITKFGLIITCDAFSPFAIAAVDEPRDTTVRTANLSCSTGGGSITCSAADGIISLKKGESITVNVKADEGYVIDTLSVGSNNRIDAAGQEGADLTVTYDDLQTQYNLASLIDVKFVSKTIYDSEVEKGETVQQPIPDEIIVPATVRKASPTPASTPAAPEKDSRQEEPASEATSQQDSITTTATAAPAPTATAAATTAPAPTATATATTAPVPTATAGTTSSITKVPASTSAPTAGTGLNQADQSLGAAASSESASPEGGAVAFADQGSTERENDMVLLTIPNDEAMSDDSNLYWLILPILAGAAAVGGALYYAFGKKRF